MNDSATATTAPPAPLEDVMIAMDVVDTLRHRQELLQKELNSEDRQATLVARLREIYAAQGIEVTDALLKEGVAALEQDRFHYEPPKKTLAVRLAHIYIKRRRWGKPFILFGLFFAIAGSHHYLTNVRPAQQAQAQLPAHISQLYEDIKSTSQVNSAVTQAEALKLEAEQALDYQDLSRAKALKQQLNQLYTSLNQQYRMEIVNKPGMPSGIWRIPDVNETARNYYLIIEALDYNGKTVALPIKSEESSKIKHVEQFGLRVDKELFDKIVRDKQDDGIIQSRHIGKKERGYLQPTYSIKTSGATIYEW